MLQLILGRLGTGKTDRLFSTAAALGARGETGQVILVPETHSHTAERRLCELGGPSISLSCEVLTFRRLAHRVFATYGGLHADSLDEGGRILLLHTAVDAVRPQLRLYGRAARARDLLSALGDTLDECRENLLDARALSLAAKECGGVLGDKLSDLSLLTDAYNAMLATLPDDARDEPTRLLERLTGTDFMRGRRLYIDSFTGFTPQEWRILEELMRQSAEVTAAFTCDTLTPNTAGPFEKARRSAVRLIRTAERTSHACTIETLDMPCRAPDLAHLEACLYDYGAPPFDNACPSIALYEARTPFSECEYIAHRILSLVRTEGLRFRDIAVVSNTIESIRGTLDAVFERYGVPLFLSERADLLAKPAPALLLSALDIISGGFDLEDILRYIKTGLTGLPEADCDLLENYALVWRLHGRDWDLRRPLTRSPRGLTAPPSPEDEAQLARLNAIRDALMRPLHALSRALSDTPDAARKAAALFRFCEDIALPAALAARAETLRGAGEVRAADEYRQLWDILCTCFDSFAEVLGTRVVDTDEFAALLRLMLSKYDIGVIPPALDRVQAGAPSILLAHRVQCVFVIGAADGVLPAPGACMGLLSDADRDTLSAYGYELPDTVSQRLEAQDNIIYTLCAAPTRLLHLSYAKSAGGDAPARPSTLFARLQALFPALTVTQEESLAGSFRLSAPRPCFDAALSGGEASLQAAHCLRMLPGSADMLADARSRARIERLPLSTPAMRQLLYGTSPRLTASRVDSFNACHFQYFVRYGLRLRPRRPASFDAPETGSFLHAILEGTVREVEQLPHRWTGTSAQDIRAIARRHTVRYAEDVLGGLADKTARFRYLFERLLRMLDAILENLHAEFSVSLFEPLDFELSFAPEGDLPPVEIPLGGGVTATLSGKVDRVDGWLHNGALYLRVVDYKSGLKPFSYTDLYHGLGLQMPVYLLALHEDMTSYLARRPQQAACAKRIVPAGILYTPARAPVLSAPHSLDDETLRAALEREMQRDGMLTDDTEILQAMEPGLSGRFIPVRLTASGSLSKSAPVVSEKRFETLFTHVHRLLRRMGREMMAGRIDAAPAARGAGGTACDYCDFRKTCHFDPSNGKDRPRYLRAMPRDAFFEAIEDRGEEDTDA